MMLAQLNEIIDKCLLNALFQPIIHFQSGKIIGYEGLIRGPSDSPLHSTLNLFKVAWANNQTVRVEHLCRRVVLERFAELGLPGKYSSTSVRNACCKEMRNMAKRSITFTRLPVGGWHQMGAAKREQEMTVKTSHSRIRTRSDRLYNVASPTQAGRIVSRSIISILRLIVAPARDDFFLHTTNRFTMREIALIRFTLGRLNDQQFCAA